MHSVQVTLASSNLLEGEVDSIEVALEELVVTTTSSTRRFELEGRTVDLVSLRNQPIVLADFSHDEAVDTVELRVGSEGRISVGGERLHLAVAPFSIDVAGLDVSADPGCVARIPITFDLSDLQPLTREEAPTCETVTFEDDTQGRNLQAGEVLSNQFSRVGLNISCEGSPGDGGPCVVFDTTCEPRPTGGDHDLCTPSAELGGKGSADRFANPSSQGNVLISAENAIDANGDGLVDNPDDDARGAIIRFSWKHESRIESVKLIDIDQNEDAAFVILRDCDGVETRIEIDPAGDNAVQEVLLQQDRVEVLTIHLPASGGVDDLAFCTPRTNTFWKLVPQLTVDTVTAVCGSVPRSESGIPLVKYEHRHPWDSTPGNEDLEPPREHVEGLLGVVAPPITEASAARQQGFSAEWEIRAEQLRADGASNAELQLERKRFKQTFFHPRPAEQ